MSLIGRLTSTEPRAVAHGPAVKLTVTVGLTSLTADILHHLVMWVESHLVISVAVKKIGVLLFHVIVIPKVSYHTSCGSVRCKKRCKRRCNECCKNVARSALLLIGFS